MKKIGKFPYPNTEHKVCLQKINITLLLDPIIAFLLIGRRANLVVRAAFLNLKCQVD